MSLRALPTLYRVCLADALAYRSNSLIWILSTNTPLVMLLLWNAVAADGPLGRYGQEEFRAYFLVTLIVRLLSGAWVAWMLSEEIRDGTLAGRLLKPLHPVWAYLFDNIAAWPIRLLLCSPIIVTAAFFIGARNVSHDWRQLALFPLALIGGWGVLFTALLAIGCLAFFWKSTTAVSEVFFALYMVLSGYVVPIDLFPPWAYAIVDRLPWAHVLSTPVRLLLGVDTFEQTLSRLAIQWSYIALFSGLSALLWRTGIKRFEAVGG